MNKIQVLGIGPGAEEYILPEVYRRVEKSDVLVGGRRNLDIFKKYGKQEILIKSDMEAVIESIRQVRKQKRVAVVVSGDPGFYSFLSVLLAHFSREELDVVPGISSIQYLFAKGVIPWQNAWMTSLHGRKLDDLESLVKRYEKVAFLTDRENTPAEIVKYLVDKGIKGKRVLVGENLSYPEERIWDFPIEDWQKQGLEGRRELSVVVIYHE